MPFFGVPIRNGVPIGLGSVAGFGISPFDPSQLFSAGEQGAWYDPSDLSTMFNDAAGTQPITSFTSNQPVGLLVDKSGRGNNATASGSARPVLSKRYNLLLATTTLATQNVTTVATSYTLRFTGAGSITLSGTATGTLNAGTHTVTATAGTLTLTVTGTVTDADLRRTIDANAFQPAYQRVVTATDYDGDGFLPYLEYSGAQAMATGSIDFSAGDKMSVFAGVTKLSDSFSIVAELSSSVGANNGSFYTGPPGFSGNYSFGSKGTTLQEGHRSLPAPATLVGTGIGDISGDVAAIRINGAQTTNTGDQGGGNYGNYPLYIGARNASSAFFTGRQYSLIVRGAQSSAAQISATESWVAQRTGVSL